MALKVSEVKAGSVFLPSIRDILLNLLKDFEEIRNLEDSLS